jgi:acetoin utilization deacetylase AcuC-like enzyme
LTAAHQLLLTSAPAIYALCRPPGHHASDSVAAGYCYINNVAVAARFIQNYTLEDMNKIKRTYNGNNDVNQTEDVDESNGKKKILIVDIDYHHGNGTQEIFYDDPTVFYISLHGHPDYPYFTGSAQEIGSGQGLGYTMNIPLLSTSTTDTIYLDSLNHALQDERVVRFNADIVIVSLGLDTWHEDPIAGMKGLQDPNTYKAIGALIKSSNGTKNRPVLFVQEGGYTIDKLGQLAVNVLNGFMEQ